MNRYLIVILAFILLLTGCSGKQQNNQLQANAAEGVSANGGSVQQSAITPAPKSESSQIAAKMPVEKHGDHLAVPAGFPTTVVPIIDSSNITDIYSDGQVYAITFQTSKSFDLVMKTYKDLMRNAKILMEDHPVDDYYTINGTKDNLNVFINVMKSGKDTVAVNINTNNYDLSAVDEGRNLREQMSNMPNVRDDTPLFVIDPQAFEPEPLDMFGQKLDNLSFKTLADSTLTTYPYEEPSDLEKIPSNVIFKQKLIPNDANSPYQDGESIPIIYDIFDEANLATEIEVKGMVEFRGKKYTLVEHIRTIKLTPVEGHAYAPNSDKVKIQVYIPHTGDEYWLVGWNSRLICSANYPKYLIHEKGLDTLVKDSSSGSGGNE